YGLRRSGLHYEYRLSRSKDEFERSLLEFSPDVVLSDHKLPLIGSLDALHMAREIYPRIPFILITGKLSEETLAGMMQQGADDYLLKDRLQRLPTAIMRALERAESEREKARYFDEIAGKEKK